MKKTQRNTRKPQPVPKPARKPAAAALRRQRRIPAGRGAPALDRKPAVAAPARESATGRGASAGDGSSYHLYLNEIARTPLLDQRRERVLAARVRRGDWRARDEMIRANLRLVVKIAHDYQRHGVPLMDLISEGNIGLVRAVERFDPTKGVKLSTYAAWWIKQGIRRALINQGQTIPLSIPAFQHAGRIRKAERKLHQILDRSPSNAELADELGEKESTIVRYRDLRVILTSLDAPLDEDGSPTLCDLLKDENAVMPDEEVQKKTSAAQVRELLGSLPPRDRSILSHRFGFHDGETRTLDEVGCLMGVTRERIRQLQKIAIDKLRNQLKRKEPCLFSDRWAGNQN